MTRLGLDIGSNSVGSAWVDSTNAKIVVGIGVFPAGVDESDDKRGEPKNAKRRMTRRTRITLARRSARKRLLRSRLIKAGLLPDNVTAFIKLLEVENDPWELRRRGLSQALAQEVKSGDTTNVEGQAARIYWSAWLTPDGTPNLASSLTAGAGEVEANRSGHPVV